MHIIRCVQRIGCNAFTCAGLDYNVQNDVNDNAVQNDMLY